MILLIDNYDSFTYNLYHYLCLAGAEVEVRRNDKIDLEGIKDLAPEAIVISPGPCTPNEAGICLDIVKNFQGKLPIFGVCLGHQTIGQIFGAKVIKDEPYHGKVGQVTHNGNELFGDISKNFMATRYHSLILEKNTLPDCLEVTATTINQNDNSEVIMAIKHKEHPIYGVQFHPESIACESGQQIINNFVNIVRG